jgi:toxin ParE1/3/4
VKRRLIVRKIAERELEDAKKYYDLQRHGLGADLIEDFYRVGEAIRQNAEAFQIVRNDIRHAIFKRYPYVAYFRIRGDRAIVTGVMHTRRDSESWLSR